MRTVDLGQRARILVNVLVAMDNGESARTHGPVLVRSRIQREHRNTGRVNLTGKAQRGGIETRTERVPDRFYAQHARAQVDDRSGALRPRIVDDQVLGAGEAGVSVKRDVIYQIGNSTP